MATMDLNSHAEERSEEEEFLSAFHQIENEGSDDESSDQFPKNEDTARYGNHIQKVCSCLCTWHQLS